MIAERTPGNRPGRRIWAIPFWVRLVRREEERAASVRAIHAGIIGVPQQLGPDEPPDRIAEIDAICLFEVSFRQDGFAGSGPRKVQQLFPQRAGQKSAAESGRE
jgi:hypothetical protein